MFIISILTATLQTLVLLAAACIVYILITRNPRLLKWFNRRDMSITYKYHGHEIDYNLHGRNEYTVNLMGYQWEYSTMQGARDFIDSMDRNAAARKRRTAAVKIA